MDSIVSAVIRKHLDRADKGFEKYDTTLDRDDLSIDDWLVHLQEELMDAVLYIEKLRRELSVTHEPVPEPEQRDYAARSDVRKRAEAVALCNGDTEPEVPNQRISVHPYRPTPTLDSIVERIRDEANRGS